MLAQNIILYADDEKIYGVINQFWNSLPNDVVDVNTVNLFKARLDRFWMNQDVKII